MLRWMSPVDLEEDGWYVLTFTVMPLSSMAKLDRLLVKKGFDTPELREAMEKSSARETREPYIDINIDFIKYDNGHWTCEHSGGPLKGTERLYGPIPMERTIGPGK